MAWFRSSVVTCNAQRLSRSATNARLARSKVLLPLLVTGSLAKLINPSNVLLRGNTVNTFSEVELFQRLSWSSPDRRILRLKFGI